MTKHDALARATRIAVDGAASRQRTRAPRLVAARGIMRNPELHIDGVTPTRDVAGRDTVELLLGDQACAPENVVKPFAEHPTGRARATAGTRSLGGEEGPLAGYALQRVRAPLTEAQSRPGPLVSRCLFLLPESRGSRAFAHLRALLIHHRAANRKRWAHTLAAFVDPTIPCSSTICYTGNMRALVMIILGLFVALPAEANIALKITDGSDEFQFHAQYHGAPFSPTHEFELHIWNCPNGQMPDVTQTSGPVCLISSDPDVYEPAQPVYSIHIPANTCIDHGSFCSFRDRNARASREGLVLFRLIYDNGRHGNKIYLQSFGDLSLATSANMYLLIAVNGDDQSDLRATFAPLRRGGWIYRF